MKALTVAPGWAMQIWGGEKTVEYRTWKTGYMGDLLITSSKKRTPGCVCGYALCVVRLMDVVPFTRAHLKAARLTQMPDNKGFAWLLKDVRPITPVPVRGKYGLWEADITPEFLPRWPQDCTEEEEDAWVVKLIDPLIYAPVPL